MATKLIDALPGTVVKIHENNDLVEFYVCQQNYESNLNESGRTLLRRKDCYGLHSWNSQNVNEYASSDLDTFLNTDYKSLFSQDIQNAMGITQFYYTPSNSPTVTTLSRSIFLLSAYELNRTASYATMEGSPLPIANILQIANLDGAPTIQWTRTPSTANTQNSCSLLTNGNLTSGYCTYANGIAPAFTLPGEGCSIDENGVLTYTGVPSQFLIPADLLEIGQAYNIRFFPRNQYNQFQTAIDGSTAYVQTGTKTMTAVINLSNSDPSSSVTYADDAVNMTPGSSEWDDFFGIYPCLFKNGVEVGNLDPNNFAQFANGEPADITSGNAGDVMIAFPRRGIQITTSGTTLTVSMTDNPNAEGYSYLAHQSGSTDKDVFYLGAYKGVVENGKLRSLSGKTPTWNQTLSSFRSEAQANGSGYEQSAFYQLLFRQCMYILKYKNLNSQAAVGMGYVSGTVLKDTGATNSKGMDWGESAGTSQMKLFGIEDCWGNLWEWIDGIFVSSSRNILTATENFNDSGSGYTDQGQGSSTDVSGYMSVSQGTSETGFLTKTGSGSASTYFCDTANMAAGGSCLFGGPYGDGTAAGIFHTNAAQPPSGASTTIGARLMYL